MPLSAALWDLDGTIVDTAPFHWLAWRDTLADEGLTLTYERFARTFGLRNDQTLPVLLGKRIEWNGRALKATNAPAAEKIVRKSYRRGFELPRV